MSKIIVKKPCTYLSSERKGKSMEDWSNNVSLLHRFGKSTHISMISNSVTDLRSYTNSAIADIGGNSTPVTPRDRRRRRAVCRRLRIKRRRLCIERRYRRIE